MIGGLFDDCGIGVFAFEVHAVCDQTVARCTRLRLGHVFAIHGIEPNELLHGLKLDGILVFAAAVRAENGVFDEGHVSTEAGSNAFGILLVAHRTIDSIQGHGIGERFEQGVIFSALVMGRKMAYRGMATGALVFQSRAVAGVGEHFVPHFGPPERVFGAVGHDGAPPIVHHIDVVALWKRFHGKGLSRNGRQIIRVFAVTA